MRRAVFVILLGVPGIGLADEGMWTLDNFPSDAVAKRHGAEIGQEWLDHVRLATVRIEGGCTGSFVSPQGLVLTNHHCVRTCITQMSSAERNIEETGFLARERDDEERCQAEQLSVLVGLEDITAQVREAMAEKGEREANEARKQTLTRLEQACESASQRAKAGKLSCESVSLYKGGQYFLYKYKRYEDVRLVFVPEVTVAAFGGDPDNFNFPRWCLDMAFLRAYENGKPASTPRFLPLRRAGADAGEPVFVSGHPGSTDRLLTVAELEFLREVSTPLWLLRYSELRGRLIQFGKTGDEPYRIIQDPLLSIENAIKVRRNELAALLDDELLARKRAQESALRSAVASDPAKEQASGSSWDTIARALASYRAFYHAHLFWESAAAFNTTLFTYARSLVRAAVEREKPNELRLREYTEAALPQLRQVLLAPRPIYTDLESVRFSFSLEKAREWLGPDDALVRQVLDGQSPGERAERLIAETQLADPEYRLRLWEGGLAAIEASDDPMIHLARVIDEPARALRKRHEDEVEAPLEVASQAIARARFEIEGTSVYPDGTFTLRVTYGAVEGWREAGELVPPFTHTRRLFERATGDDPFRLPESWIAARDALDEDTRFNFVATTDITGGNSGSPVIDAGGNLVGIAFDGNRHSIAGAYWFDESVNRTVAVHPSVMFEALQVVYSADSLLDELTVR